VDVVEMPEEEDREGEEPLVAVDDDREVEDDLGEEDHREPLRPEHDACYRDEDDPRDAPQYWNFSLYPYFPKRGYSFAVPRLYRSDWKKSSMSCLPMKSWRSSCFLPG